MSAPRPQLDLFKGKQARDAGIEQTSATNSAWLALGIALLPVMARTRTSATGEEMRVWLTEHGLPAPKSPHAWGALTQHAVRCGIIRDTMRTERMRDVRSHARRTPVWEFINTWRNHG